MSGVDQAGLDELEQQLKAAVERKTYRKFDFFEPYPKQYDFFEMGATKRERLLRAGNQLGKTYAGAFETACHLTGDYPDWWPGRRWSRPTRGWAAGETGLLARNVSQKLLCGDPGVLEAFGTGMIPKECFHGKPTLARGVADAFDTVQVKHKSGGISILQFKSYEQGRTKFQGDTIDFAWLDEEPDLDVYSETLTRVTATGGMLFMTFTPLKGMSEVVMRFLQESSPDRGDVNMVIEDAKHIPVEERARIIAGYPAHERDARVRGVPMLGSGRIFQYADDAVSEPTLTYIPQHWVKIWGVDFGIDHPFAAVLLLWDRDNDVIHIHHAFKMKDAKIIQHAERIKSVAAAVPVAWPQDGWQRDRGQLIPLAKLYRPYGVLMLAQHAAYPDGSNSTEAGIKEMDERFGNGKLKVGAHLSEWFNEFRIYHRKDGLIVKLNDDLMSATRVGIMARRFAKAVPLGPKPLTNHDAENPIAKGVDFDVFGV